MAIMSICGESGTLEHVSDISGHGTNLPYLIAICSFYVLDFGESSET